MSKWLASAALLLMISLSGCARAPHEFSQESYVFGTRVDITIVGVSDQRARAAVSAVLLRFDSLHHRLHAWEPGELSTINDAFAAGRTVAITADVTNILTDAMRYSAQSGGTFNPAIGNLIRLWGFQSDQFVARLPDPQAIQQLLVAHPQMSDIVIIDGWVSSRNPAVRVDLGGYAKGYALDIALQILRQYGIRNAVVNIGGNVIALGQHGDRPWLVGIQDPRHPSAVAKLPLYDGEAIGTSGDYQRYFVLHGQRYCHIINPYTGWPAQGVQSVTVLIPPGPHAGVLSDVASKPLFIAGVNGWRAAATRMGIQSAMLIDALGVISMTPAMQQRLTLLHG